MREHKLDVVIVPGGPSHWSFGGGMLWLTGHWEWHALCCYVVVPLEGEPTLIYSMGGTHAEAVRRQVEIAVKDVRHSRNGRYADIMVERIRELKLETRPHRLDGDRPAARAIICRSTSTTCCARICPTPSWCSPRAFCTSCCRSTAPRNSTASARPASCARDAMNAMVARARPGVKEYELRAAAGAAILEGGGDIDFLIIGSTPMDEPGADFRQSAPVRPRAEEGRHHQHGARRRLSRLHRAGRLADLRRRADRDGEKVLGRDHAAGLPEDHRRDRARQAGREHAHASKFFRDKGVQSRPTQCHGIDLVTDKPHVIAEHVSAEPFEQVLKPGMMIMAEPNPITPDGMFGIFLGHTFIVTDKGHEVVDDFPLEIAVSRC